MVDKAFVDTNILLRAFLVQFEGHREADLLMKPLLATGVELWISGQVIREFIVQATHPKTLAVPLTIPEVIAELGTITKFVQVADETSALRVRLFSLIQTYPTSGKQIHDANIVATMLRHGIDTLLTRNVADFKRFSSEITLLSPDPHI